MRDHIIIAATFLATVAASALAVGPQAHHAAVARAKAAGGASYDYEETFETTPGYDLSWTEDIDDGVIDEDYSTAALVGDESLRVQRTTGTSSAWISVTAADEYYGYCRFKSDSDPSYVLNIGQGATPDGLQSRIRFRVGGMDCRANGGSFSSQTTTGLSTGTEYHLWWHCVKSSGTDGLLEIVWATTSTFPGWSGNTYTSSTDGTDTGQIDYVGAYVGSGAGNEVILDSFFVDSSEIGSQ